MSSGHHVLRQTMSVCPSLVMLILITWLRFYPTSPVLNTVFLYLIESLWEEVQDDANILFLIKISPNVLHPLMVLVLPCLCHSGCKMIVQLQLSLHISSWLSTFYHKQEYSLIPLFSIHFITLLLVWIYEFLVLRKNSNLILNAGHINCYDEHYLQRSSLSFKYEEQCLKFFREVECQKNLLIW